MKNHRILKSVYFSGIVIFFLLTLVVITHQNAFAQLTEADCRLCHEDPNVVANANIPGRHHSLVNTPVPPDTVRPFPDGDLNGNYDCFSCHIYGPDPDTGFLSVITFRDCLYCHTGVSHEEGHDQTFLPSPDCSQCHVANVVTEHVANRGLVCDVCHASPDPAVQTAITNGQSGQPVYCAECHGGDAGLHELDHDQTFLPSPDCQECHVPNVFTEHVTNRSLGCGVCHDSTDPNVINAIETGKSGQPVFCADCHGGAAGFHEVDHDQTFLPSPDCLECHVPNVFTEHVVNNGLGCNVCHSSTDPDVQNAIINGSNGIPVFCADCHGPGAGAHTGAHDQTFVPSPSCLECHVDNVATEHVTNGTLTCGTCHFSTDPVVQDAITNGKNGIPVFCTECHGADAGMHVLQHDKATVPYPDCAQCHADNVVTEHVTRRGFGCGVCHDSTDPVVQNTIAQGRAGQMVYCANCHVMFGNHTVQHDRTEGDIIAYHEQLPMPVYCFACHTSQNPLVFAAIERGMAENFIPCLDCHPTTPPNQPPVADAGPDQTVQPGQVVNFSGAGSNDPDGTIISYSWDFGDGMTGSGVTVSHIYNAAGTYIVTLTVTDDGGATGTDTAVVTIHNQPPVADAGPDQIVQTGQQVSFSGAGSYDPDGSIVSYSWDFGDGMTGSGVSVSHIYNAAGTYIVTLTVTDDGGATGTDTAVVTVYSPQQNQPPVAVADVRNHDNHEKRVRFTAERSYDIDGDIEDYFWDFGDGSTGSGVKVSHYYRTRRTRTYTVTLTVTDNDGATGSDTITVTVGKDSDDD